MTDTRRITRLLERNVGAQRLSVVFDDFAELSAIAICNAGSNRSLPDWVARERRYLETAAKYSRPQLDRFAEALACVALQMDAKPGDVLGQIYMTLDLGNERLGQFYTPDSVATLVSELTVESLLEAIHTKGTAELYEPACGAGSFLVATTQALHRRGVNYQQVLSITAEDISIQAVHMAFIHLSLLGVPAVVHHRNSLTLETFSSWPTRAHHRATVTELAA